MHTFFINTSKRELDGYDILFDIHYENKALVSMECPMSDWYDSDKGYAACVRKMSEMIDSYAELNNAFNLIVYVDLPENAVYSSIQRDAFHDGERDECCRAMHILFTHIISESIVQELINSGRKPQNVLIMFGEEKKFTDFLAAPDDAEKDRIMQRVLSFIGLPSSEDVEQTAKAVYETDAADTVSLFRKAILAKCGEELVPGIRDRYQGEFQLWCGEIIQEAQVSGANRALFERICKINQAEADRLGVVYVSCPYDYYASRVNKSVLALSTLNVALHLLKCVEYNSVYAPQSDFREKKTIEFHPYTVQEIAPVLASKKGVYAGKLSEIESLLKSYAELNLAPPLEAFDHAKFGLDKYGDLAADLIVRDAASEKEGGSTEARNDLRSKSDEEEDPVLINGNRKEVTVEQAQGRPLFSQEEYPVFDYNYTAGRDQVIHKNTTPEQYIEQAKKVRRHHLDYLKKLEVHVSRVLSNYAGKSKENKPALLQIGGYRYASRGKETRVFEEVECVAEKAYDSMVKQYMEFCAGRSVAITDIEEQCNWFVSRVNQIRESLGRLKKVAGGLCIGILALYLPFVVIQFEAIMSNVLTLWTAVGSIAVPLVLLYAVFSVKTAEQKKKYRKAWEEFEEKSNQVLEENKIAVEKYDQLLSRIVPSLRWVYEYKLDVSHCAECYSVADAKLDHHRRKLRERVAAIQDILTDLEYRDPGKPDQPRDGDSSAASGDYSAAFCSGKENCRFYTVIDEKILTELGK